MCEYSIVQYSCGCEVTKQIRSCFKDTNSIEGKEMAKYCALRCRAEGLQAWCVNQKHKIGCTKLCIDCSTEKRRAMREAVPGTTEWENRQNWNWWKGWKANPKTIAERKAERLRRRYTSLESLGESVTICPEVPKPFSPLEDGHISTESYELVRKLMRFHRWSVAGGGWWAEVGESGE